MKIKWSDQLGSRDRKAGLLIRREADVYWFAGGSDENVRVVSAVWKKDGKWSATSYTVEVQDGAEALPVVQGFESGKWREGFCLAIGLPADGQWSAIADKLGVPVSALVADGKVVIRTGPARSETQAD